MLFKYYRLFVILMVGVLFLACSDDRAEVESKREIRGQLIDSKVIGVEYRCGKVTDLTDKNGSFSCVNLPISFYIGNITLGEVITLPSDGKIFPQDIVGVNRLDVNNSNVLKIALLLQSLDSDENASNGIKIEKSRRDKFDEEIVVWELSLDKLKRVVKNKDKTIIFKNEDDVISHLSTSVGIVNVNTSNQDNHSDIENNSTAENNLSTENNLTIEENSSTNNTLDMDNNLEIDNNLIGTENTIDVENDLSIDNNTENNLTLYRVHKNITTTIFWIGEKASKVNQNISNIASVWDDMWMMNYNGIDNPTSREGWNPADFEPKENPFYFALPYNDFDRNGSQKADISSYIPWVTSSNNNRSSVCKNRWIKITKDDKTVYAQWEDVGPFGEDDKAYVFGDAQPQNMINHRAGLDVSPAVRDYLNLSDINSTNWQFVDEKDVPDGPWKNIVTKSSVNWVDWYKPDTNTSWQWQLKDDVNTSYPVEIYDIDLFDSNASLIKSLQNEGKKVICYFSAGSYENWREDKNSFPQTVLGNIMDGWEDEKWLDVSNEALYPIMKARLDLAVEKGCDGVEPDNMDGHTNNTGFNLNASDQLTYNKLIANEARKRGLSVGLKNDLDQIIELEPFYDFSVNEQCHQYSECDKMQPFIDANKPVLNAEYAQRYVDNNNSEREILCEESNNLKFQTLVLPLYLDDSFRYSCK